MPGNTAPIYSSKGSIQWGSSALTTLNDKYDGSGTTVDAFTAGTAGNFVQRVRFKASGSTVAAVGRIFINNNAGVGILNNFLYEEVTLPAVTATATAATTTIEVPMNFVLPDMYKIRVSISQNQPNGGWFVGAIGGSYDPA